MFCISNEFTILFELLTNKYIIMREGKSLSNKSASDAAKNIPDVKFFGDGDTWKLICKAWSEEEDWMKSTKAMEIPGVGCVVQVTTQLEDQISEAVTFVPGVRIKTEKSPDGMEVVKRELVSIQ